MSKPDAPANARGWLAAFPQRTTRTLLPMPLHPVVGYQSLASSGPTGIGLSRRTHTRGIPKCCAVLPKPSCHRQEQILLCLGPNHSNEVSRQLCGVLDVFWSATSANFDLVMVISRVKRHKSLVPQAEVVPCLLALETSGRQNHPIGTAGWKVAPLHAVRGREGTATERVCWHSFHRPRPRDLQSTGPTGQSACFTESGSSKAGGWMTSPAPGAQHRRIGPASASLIARCHAFRLFPMLLERLNSWRHVQSALSAPAVLRGCVTLSMGRTLSQERINPKANHTTNVPMLSSPTEC